MVLVYCLFVFGLANFAYGDLSFTTEPCVLGDMKCLNNNTQNFLYSTSAGDQRYDIKPIDPVTIPNIDKFSQKTAVSIHLKDIKVTGFKHQRISIFKLDKRTNTVNLKIIVDFSLDSDITIKLHGHDPSKVFSGKLKANASAEGNTTFGFSIKKDDNGVEHYEVSPETISCELLEEPNLTQSEELKNELLNDADAQEKINKYKKVEETTHQEIMCDVLKTVLGSTIHNIRVTARILPKSAYFKNVEEK